MSGLENLNTRLNYKGGKQEQRMQKDKLETLRKSLLYSYQAATAILKDGKEFRCLINPDKLKVSAEDKIISIPFEDICLNKTKLDDEKTIDGLEKIDINPGDVFTWKETNTDWLVYLRRIEEDAYFRAEIRKCNNEIKINDTNYKIHVYGPAVKNIAWETKHQSITWNNLNYDLQMYITKNDETIDFFHRFTKININNKPWEVQVVDSLSTDGILIVSLKETFVNNFPEKKDIIKEIDETKPYIEGNSIVYPYEQHKYIIHNNSFDGIWKINNNKAKIIDFDLDTVIINIITGKSGSFILSYEDPAGLEENITLDIKIKSI